MRRQSGLLEDLISIAARMSWQAGVTAAVLSWAALHFAAVHFSASRAATTVGELGSYAAGSLLGTLATLLQYVIPVCFLMGALASRLTQSQARGLFRQARLGGPEAVRSMTWREFEQLVGQVLRGRGYDVTRSEPGPDGGVDLLATKGSERVLVQCKHWRAQRVGVKVVRELYGVVAAQGATGGYVVTSGVFTQEAWAFAQACNVELVDGNKLGSLIRQIGRAAAEGVSPYHGRLTDPAPKVQNSAEPHCPQCGSPMTKRTAKRGPQAGEAFWGCSRFPACRGIRRMPDASLPLLGSETG
jgi:restriction system protein